MGAKAVGEYSRFYPQISLPVWCDFLLVLGALSSIAVIFENTINYWWASNLLNDILDESN